MPKFEVSIEDARYEVDAPDEQTAWDWANYTHAQPTRSVLEAAVPAAKNIVPTLSLANKADQLANATGEHPLSPGELARNAAIDFAQHPSPITPVTTLAKQLGKTYDRLTLDQTEKQDLIEGMTEDRLRIDQNNREIQQSLGAEPSTARRVGVAAVSNIVQQGPGLAASIALKNPAPALATGTAMQKGASMGEALDAGADLQKAQEFGDITGTFEAAFELTPMGNLVKSVGVNPIKDYIKKYIWEETKSELATTFAQKWAEEAVALHPEKSPKEFLAELGDEMLMTALTTPISAGVQSGIVGAADKGVQMLYGRNTENKPPEQTPPPPTDAALSLKGAPDLTDTEDDNEGNSQILDVDRILGENDSILSDIETLVNEGQPVAPPEETATELNKQADAMVQEANAFANPIVEGLDSAILQPLKDEAASRSVKENESNWGSDPNSAVPIAERVISKADNPELVGKRLGDISPEMLTPGTVIQVGVDSQVRPTHALDAALTDLKRWVAEFNPEGVYVLLPNDLPKGTQGAHAKHKGVHFILPRHVDDLSPGKDGTPRTLGQHNPSAYKEFVSSLAHEFGHSLVTDHLLSNLDRMQAMQVASEIESGTVSETSLALMDPVAAKIVRDWMRIRNLALENKISGRAFGALWFSPTKLGNQELLKNSLWDSVRKKAANNNWTAMDLVKAYGGVERLSLHEFMAEQLPKYLHHTRKWGKTASAKALPGGGPVQIEQLKAFFEPLLSKLEQFFGRLKMDKWVKPQDSYIEWVEQLARSAKVQGEEVTEKDSDISDDELRVESILDTEETRQILRASVVSLKKAEIISSEEMKELLAQISSGDLSSAADTVEGYLGEKLKFDRSRGRIRANEPLNLAIYSEHPVPLAFSLTESFGRDQMVTQKSLAHALKNLSPEERQLALMALRLEVGTQKPAKDFSVSPHFFAKRMASFVPAIQLEPTDAYATYGLKNVNLPTQEASTIKLALADWGTMHENHFGADTFGHYRQADALFSPRKGAPKQNARFIVEIQSDLFQHWEEDEKDLADYEADHPTAASVRVMRKVLKLFRNSWMEFITQIAAIQAARDGIHWLRFPTAETAADIQGWRQGQETLFDAELPALNPELTGQVRLVKISSGDYFAIFEKTSGGSYSDYEMEQYFPSMRDIVERYVRQAQDLSTTINPEAKGGYLMYKERLPKYLQHRYGAKLSSDGKWWEFSPMGLESSGAFPFSNSIKGFPYSFDLSLVSLERYMNVLGFAGVFDVPGPVSEEIGRNRIARDLAKQEWAKHKARSKFFTKWFGDWTRPETVDLPVHDINGVQIGTLTRKARSSVVADPTGHPITVYRGSGTDIYQQFDGLRTEEQQNGMFFTTNPGYAETRAEWKAQGNSKGFVAQFYLNIRNPYIVQTEGMPNYKIEGEALAYAKANGYDGVMILGVQDGKEFPATHYIVWDKPGQVKFTEEHNTTFSDSSSMRYDKTTPEGYANYTVAERAKHLSKEIQQRLRKGLNSFGNWHYRLEQLEQLAHIKPWITGLVNAAKYEAAYEEAKAQLIENAYKVADRLSWMGDGNMRLLFDITREEMKNALHLTDIRKVDGQWRHFASERLAEAIKAKGIDPQSERGKLIAEVYLEAKNALQMQMNRMERVLLAKRLRKYQSASPEMQQRAVGQVMKTFKDLRDVPFWPHQRFGRFHVIGQRRLETGEMVRFYHEAFDSNEEAQEAAARLKKKHKTNIRLVDSGERSMDKTIVALLPQNFLEDAVEALGLSQEDADILKDLTEPVSLGGAMKAWDTQDRFAEGGSRDFFRNFSDFTLNVGNLIAKMEYRGYFDVAAKEIKDQRKEFQFDATPEGKAKYKELTAALDQVQKHQQQLFSPSEEFYAIRGFISLLYLSFNVGTAILNLTTLLNTHNWLIANAGVKGEQYFLRGFQYGTESLLSKEWGDDTLRKTLELAKQKGIINQTYAYMLSGQASSSLMQRLATKSFLGRMTRGVVDTVGMSAFKMTESTLRTVTFLGLVQMIRAQDPSLTPEALTEEAARQTRLIAGNYLSSARPDIMHGKIRSLFTVFMTYTQLMAFHAYGGMEMGQRRQNAQMGRNTPLGSYTLYTLVTLGLLAGGEGLPGAESLLDLLDAIGRALGVTDNLRKDIQEYIKDTLEMAPMLIMHGLGHNVGGYDLSGRLGVGRLIPGTEAVYNQQADNAPEYYGSLMMSLMGVTGGTLRAFYNTIGELHAGMQGELPWEVTFNNAAKKLPGAMGMGANAYEWASVGPRGPKGGALLLDEEGRPRTATAGETIMRGMGFRTTEETQRNEEFFMERDIAVYWQSRRANLLDAYDYATLVDEDVEGDVREGIARYNRHLRELGRDYWTAFGITGKDLSSRAKQTRKAARMEQQQKVSGIKARAKSRLADEAFGSPESTLETSDN